MTTLCVSSTMSNSPTTPWAVPHGPSQSAPIPVQLFTASAKAGARTVMNISATRSNRLTTLIMTPETTNEIAMASDWPYA